jgi:hypothetical protein
MKHFSKAAFDNASIFLERKARRLDLAIFKYHFDGGSPRDVAFELSKYQNSDGGFGHALEPDLRTPTSSPLATAVGLQILADLGYTSDFSQVQGAVKYLFNSFQESSGKWVPISGDAKNFPHAPWWHNDEGSLADNFSDFLIIPRAHVVGLLHHFSDLVPAKWLESTTESTVTDIEKIEQLGTGGGDDLLYAIILAEADKLPEKFKARLTARIRSVTLDVVITDPKMWNSYVITPLKIAPTPNSVPAELIWNEIHQNLDYLIDSQANDGSWHPVWNWGDVYPEEWEKAKLEWQGHLTVENLNILDAYGRIQ